RGLEASRPVSHATEHSPMLERYLMPTPAVAVIGDFEEGVRLNPYLTSLNPQMTGSHTDRIVCFDSVERSPAEGHCEWGPRCQICKPQGASQDEFLFRDSYGCFPLVSDWAYNLDSSCCFLGPIPIKACFRDTDAQALRHMVREPLALSMPRGGTVDQLAHFGKFKSKLRTIWGRVHSDGLHSSLGDVSYTASPIFLFIRITGNLAASAAASPFQEVASRDATPTLCTDPESST
ncbi:hypothetical protein FCULG_00002067, partial [Fusarium culmorum]